MKTRVLFLLTLTLLAAGNRLHAQGTTFTYDGQLQNNHSPANGTYNFIFSLYAGSSGGAPVAAPVTTNGVNVANGLFTVQLDFGAAVWNGETNWLEIAVEADLADSFTTLAPRQQITPTPYAIFATTASNLSGTLPAARVTGTIPLAQLPGPVVTNGARGVVIAGAFTGNGGGLTNVPASWQTVSGTNQPASANYAYLLTNNPVGILTLPASPKVGDIVTVSGVGSNGWLVTANAGQTIPGSTGLPAGVIWTAQNSPNTGWKQVVSSADGTKLAAILRQAGPIYTSDDSGVTWTAQNGSPAATWSGIASSADGTKLVAAIGNPNPGQIYTSGDSGVTWTLQNNSPLEDWVAVASSADGTTLAAADIGQIYTSGDSGVTWLQTSANGDIWGSIASSSDGTTLVAADFDRVYTSSDSGATWTMQNVASEGVSEGVVASSADGTKLVVAAQGGAIYTSSDSGVTWSLRSSAPSAIWASVASSADGTKLAAGVLHGSIYTSGDSGVTWIMQNSGSQYWDSLALSADGTKLVAADIGVIYTSDAISGFRGLPNTTVQFQYVGQGVWQPLGQMANLLAGGLTTNIVVTVPTGTATLCFTNGVLRAAY